MKKLLLASVAIIGMMTAAPAMAIDWGFGLGGFAGGITGVGVSNSGAGNWSNAGHFGSATSNAGTQSFGQAESAFGIGVGQLPNGSPASGAYGNFFGASVASGSQSQAETTSNGGFSYAGTGGGGFANTQLTGIGLGVGGFVVAP